MAHVPSHRQHPDRRCRCWSLFLLLVIGGGKQAGAVSDADDAVGTQLAGADNAGQARAAAFEARSQEALTLINRGNGAANEVNWQLGNDIVTREMSGRLGSDEWLSNGAADSYASYAEAHIEIRTLDNGGNWDASRRGQPRRPADTGRDQFGECVRRVRSGTSARSRPRRLRRVGPSRRALSIR